MPHNTTVLDLHAEHDRLSARYADARETATDDSASDAERQHAREAAQEAMRHAAAVEWLAEEYGPGCDIVVGGLTMGEDAQVLDATDDAYQHGGQGRGQGIARNFTVAAGLERAPFLPDAPSMDDKKAAVADLPRHVGKYLYDRVAAQDTLDPDLGNGLGGGS